MGTTFTVKATQATQNKDVQYAVDLGVSILTSKLPEEIEAAAIHTLVVNVQNYKGSLLRQSTSVDDVIKTLIAQGYPNATCEIYTPTTTPKGMVIDGVTYSKQDIAKLIKHVNATKV